MLAEASGGSVTSTSPLPLLAWMLKLPAGSTEIWPRLVVDESVAVDLAQVDILGMCRHAHFALGFGDAQVVGVQSQVAGQRGELQLSDRGMQMNGTADVFKVHVAEDFAVEGDFALNFGEGQIVQLPSAVMSPTISWAEKSPRSLEKCTWTEP